MDLHFKMQTLRFEQIVLLYFHLNLPSNLHLFTFIESESCISEHKCDYEFKIIGVVHLESVQPKSPLGYSSTLNAD